MRDHSTPKPTTPPATHHSSIPKTAPLSVIAASIKSNVRNILLASPDFPRLYADVVLTYAPNSNEARILAPHYQKIIDAVNAQTTQTETTNTETKQTKIKTRTNMPNVKSCTHIKVTGVRCGSPALRGEPFCYFHQRLLRGVKGPDSRLHRVALLEDEEAIQASVMEVVNALVRGTIELKRAELVLRALNTAVRNSRRVRFHANSDKMIKEIPTYSAPPTGRVEPSDADLPPVAATNMYLRDRTYRNHWPDYQPAPAPSAQAAPPTVKTNHQPNPVGTAAPGCPGGPEVSGRSPATQSSATKKNAAVDPTRPKPPVSDRGTQILQSHKHRAPSG